jgi:hypothetical protein
MKIIPYLVHVKDINGNRVETVTGKTTKNGSDVLTFASGSWAYRDETRVVTTEEAQQAFALLREAVALMPLGTKKRANWLSRTYPIIYV